MLKKKFCEQRPSMWSPNLSATQSVTVPDIYAKKI